MLLLFAEEGLSADSEGIEEYNHLVVEMSKYIRLSRMTPLVNGYHTDVEKQSERNKYLGVFYN